jgi:2-polyprenyl-3-methyl-5-hydroxy-6-metoxy-1,4-benzoquinol methylase
VTGWDQKLDRIDKNADFYKFLEERDVEKEGFWKEKYDAVVFSDVLEHLYNADKVLRQSRDLLNAGGKVLVSLPNVAYFENRLGLLKVTGIIRMKASSIALISGFIPWQRQENF